MKRCSNTNLKKILDLAVTKGFLTDKASNTGISHSKGFLFSEDNHIFLNNLKTTDLAIDLGTGGGLPGLILSSLTDCLWLLVDRSKKRCSFLNKAVNELDLTNRVEVVECSAEELSDNSYREKVKLVTARGFATPSITSECAAPLLREDGLFVVSEPPYINKTEVEKRWPVEGLSLLGLKHKNYWHTGLAGYRSFFRESYCPDVYPRKFKKILQNPLF
ncbi:MAG: hypothetical protein CL517_00775 [Actinobacteria bacterium]|nr:hypothetical protein [Actinomycetota bacterium]|tara:strand:+ start:15234 stop:15887 length:654 start_codon:yes stop_codon:yes gene_type:complete